MSNPIERRLAAAERRLKPTRPDFQVIRVSGGLPGPVRFAAGGGMHWVRAEDESMEAFGERVIAEAKSGRAKFVVIGGLPKASWLPEGYVRNDSSYLSEVPPEELY